MAGLAAGSLDRLIRIERATLVDDGFQTRDGDWAKLVDVYASYRPGKGSERIEQAAQRAEMPVTFRIRWSARVADVSAKDRVRYPVDGPVYEIVAPPVELGWRDGIELICVVRD